MEGIIPNCMDPNFHMVWMLSDFVLKGPHEQKSKFNMVDGRPGEWADSTHFSSS